MTFRILHSHGAGHGWPQCEAAEATGKEEGQARREAEQGCRQTSFDPTIRLQNVDRWPILECLLPEWIYDDGIGHCIIARRSPDGQTAFANYLVDVDCLGVKDCVWQILPIGDYRDMLKEVRELCPLRSVTPDFFAKFVLKSTEFAKSFGFAPHPDFRHAQLLLSGIDPGQCAEEFRFGRDGKPHYVRGPHDSDAEALVRIERVVAVGGTFVDLLIDDDDLESFVGSNSAGDDEDP